MDLDAEMLVKSRNRPTDRYYHPRSHTEATKEREKMASLLNAVKSRKLKIHKPFQMCSRLNQTGLLESARFRIKENL